MDETIGVKGGANDRKRVIRISHKKKKKLQQDLYDEELRELEKKVRRKQIYTLVKTLPLVIGGETVRTIYYTSHPEAKRDLEDENSRWRIKEYDSDVTNKTPGDFDTKEARKRIIRTPSGKKIVVYIPDGGIISKGDVKDDDHVTLADQPRVFDEFKTPKKVGGVVSHKPDSDGIALFTDEKDDFSSLTPEGRKTFDKLKSRKLVDEYEKKLKDIRFELRQLVYEYNVLVDEGDRAIFEAEVQSVLDRLSAVIAKIEELKNKINIVDLSKYDDNYIYYLIEEYFQEFREGREVAGFKDSPLYIMISEKLDELDHKKDGFKDRVSRKKDELHEKEEDFERLKSKYYSIDRLNQELLEFQYQQDALLKEIRDKVKNATTITEKVKVEFQGMNRQSRRLMRMLAFQMFLPGPRFAKGMAASMAAYLYFVNNVLNPNTTTRRYHVITVKDYSTEIEKSISELTDAISLLGKTGKQIDKIIAEIESEYKDYIGVLPECSEMLSNLHKIRVDVLEKEYEMEQLRIAQEKELEHNNAKVKKIGEYPVN